jgi:hypothetical protein
MTQFYAKYLGGAHLPGVPARDLTAAEYEAHRVEIEACPDRLYEVIGDETPEGEEDNATGEL